MINKPVVDDPRLTRAHRSKGARRARTKNCQPWSGAQATAVLRNYNKEMQRQRLFVQQAVKAREDLRLIANGMRQLLSDKRFVAMVLHEGMPTVPLPLAGWIKRRAN